MASVFNAYLAYQFIKILTTPWKKTDAYKLGIIDDKGTVLRKSADLETSVEKNAYSLVHRLVFNLKKILEKIPGGRSRIASYAAAFALLRENKDNDFSESELELFEELLIDYINECERNYEEDVLLEDIANSVGTASNLAGLGTTPPGTFAGMRVFPVKSDTYVKLFKGKKWYARWNKYIETEEAAPIREYIRKKPKNKIVIQDQVNGTMMILYRHNEI
jgi:hypothetical protein